MRAQVATWRLERPENQCHLPLTYVALSSSLSTIAVQIDPTLAHIGTVVHCVQLPSCYGQLEGAADESEATLGGETGGEIESPAMATGSRRSRFLSLLRPLSLLVPFLPSSSLLDRDPPGRQPLARHDCRPVLPPSIGHDACSRRRVLSSRWAAVQHPAHGRRHVGRRQWRLGMVGMECFCVSVAFGPEWRTIEEVSYGRTETGHSSAPSRGAYCY